MSSSSSEISESSPVEFTQFLNLGQTTEPDGATLVIWRKWRICDFLFISIMKPDGTSEHAFSLKWFFMQGRNYYLAVTYPPDLTGDDDIIPVVVLKLIAPDTLMTISERELKEIRSGCVQELEKGKRSPVKAIYAVMGEFADRNESAEKHCLCPGSTIGELRLERLIGEGSFSWVFQGKRQNKRSGSHQSFHPAAVKVAKPVSFLCPQHRKEKTASVADPWFSASALQSKGLEIGTGYVGAFDPDPEELLVLQAKKIWEADDPALVRIFEISRDDCYCWCEMELLEGPALRNMISEGHVPVSIFIELASKMDRLAQNPRFAYHGDLKPENIIIHQGEIKLIDPGWFGHSEKMPVQGVVTSPAYYPLLRPDDLFAMGFVMWEAALGKHPFFWANMPAEEDEPTQEKSRLGSWVKMFERTGNHLLRPLRRLPRPADMKPSINPEIEALLLKALGMDIVEGGKIEKITDRPSAYATFAELTQDLKRLRHLGIENIYTF